MSAREDILGRVRAALKDVPAGSSPEETEVPWTYAVPGPTAGVADRFAETTAEYQATVVETDPAGVAGAVTAALEAAGVRRLVAPSGVEPGWLSGARESGIEVLDDSDQLSANELDTIDAVLTAAAVGIASTGTIVLDHGPDQGRRALTLVPDLHVCVIREDQVLADVPEAVARLRVSVDDGRPLTWISGPSATSDIELDRVEGVHGPRNLHVVLVRAAAPA